MFLFVLFVFCLFYVHSILLVDIRLFCVTIWRQYAMWMSVFLLVFLYVLQFLFDTKTTLIFFQKYRKKRNSTRKKFIFLYVQVCGLSFFWYISWYFFLFWLCDFVWFIFENGRRFVIYVNTDYFVYEWHTTKNIYNNLYEP